MKLLRWMESVVDEKLHGALLVCPDTARANRGETWYLPYSDRSYSLMPCLVLRMKGICKAVGPNGAERFLEGGSFAFHLCDESRLKELRMQSLPWSEAYGFDKSVVVGPTIEKAPFIEILRHKLVLKQQKDRYPVESITDSDPEELICMAISQISWACTINYGDWILLSLLPSAIGLQLPCRTQLFAQEQLLLDEIFR